jgi:general secretion pathway protein H
MQLFPSVPTAAKAAPGRQQTSRTLNADREAGFTLIEVVAVMLIIALLVSLVVTLPSGTGRAQLKAVALETAALMRRERLGAILSGHVRQVSIDAARRALVGDGQDLVVIPRDVVLDVLGVDEPWSGRAPVIRFEPDGASTGAVLKLSRQEAEYEILVNWYTGAVAVNPL